jgi:hypothetical protein
VAAGPGELVAVAVVLPKIRTRTQAKMPASRVNRLLMAGAARTSWSAAGQAGGGRSVVHQVRRGTYKPCLAA